MKIKTKRKFVQFYKKLLRLVCELLYWVLFILTIPRLIYWLLGGDEENLLLNICALDMMIAWDVENNIYGHDC
jgi:hypothetical protein